MTIICDAGPLIHLDELGCLDLLSDFEVVIVPDAVWLEVKRHRPSALRRRVVKLDRKSATMATTPELIQFAQTFLLAHGEVEALQLMQETPQAIFLTDDAAARLVAERLGYEVHGTLGVVIRALRRNQRTKRQVANLLRSIRRRSTLFVDARLLQLLIDEVQKA